MAPASREPYPGWVDSLNGPIGIFVAGASGVLRITYASPTNTPDLVPVDFACNSFIAAASYIGQKTERQLNEKPQNNLPITNEIANPIAVNETGRIAEICPVFNCTVSAQAAITWSDLITTGLEVLFQIFLLLFLLFLIKS